MKPGPASPLIVPHSPAVEVSVLGAILQDGPTVERALRELRPTDFFDDRHRLIFSTFAALRAGGTCVDEIVLIRELVRQGRDAAAGGSAYIYGLRDLVPTTANIAKHIEILRHQGQLRRIISECTAAAERARTDGTDPGSVLADLWEQLRDLEPVQTASAVLLRLSDVAPEDVTWLWPGRIPIGKINLVVGDPGLGKSFLTLDLASRISRGGVYPDGAQAPLGNVILLTAEDGIADTIRGRVDALEGDPSRIHILAGVGDPEKPRSFNLAEDVAHLEDAVLRTRACMVVIDPLSAYLGGTDSHKDSDVRGVLAPLAAVAERNRVAVLCVVHMNKSQQRQALYRAQGSLAFVAAARAVFGVAEDQETPGRRLFVPMKMNLASRPPGLAFRIDDGRLVWEEGSFDADANQVMAGEEETAERSEREDAMQFLRQVLADGPVPAAEVKRQATEALIAPRTLKRAKGELKVQTHKRSFREGWVWELPTKGTTSAPVTSLGPLRTSSCQLAPLQGGQPSEEGHEGGHHTGEVVPFDTPLIQQQLTSSSTTKNTKGAKEEVSTRAREGEGKRPWE